MNEALIDDLRKAADRRAFEVGGLEDSALLRRAANAIQNMSVKLTPVVPCEYAVRRWKCPACNRRVRSGAGSSNFVRDNYCQRCGRKLDWEAAKEES